MNRKRLMVLRNALIEHATNPGNLVFNLGAWAKLPAKYVGQDPVKAVRGARLAENFCGTAACAMGLAASIPAFNRAGLGLSTPSWNNECALTINKDLGYFSDGYDVASTFFGLSREDAIELFCGNRYRREDRKNPVAVADKITALLEVTA